MATDADEETTACIARLLQEDANQLAWVRGDSPERPRKNASDDDDDYAPSGAAAKRRKAGEAKPAAAPKAPKAPKAPRPPKVASAAPRRVAAVSLGDLVKCGKLAPGLGALTSQYKGETYTADLGPSGMIHFRGSFFENCSSFSLHVKRLTAPDRKADDGWGAVRHRGRTLAEIKAEALAAGLIPGYPATVVGGDGGGDGNGDGDGGGDDAGLPLPPPPRLPAAPAEAAAPRPAPKKSEGAARVIAAASPRRSASPACDESPPPGFATEYMRARPQRQRQAPQRLAPSAEDGGAGADADDLQLVTAAPYTGDAATDAVAADLAPLRISVSSSAALVMDFHSHLSGAEVIGFLGGRWNAATRQLRVLRALPAAQLVSGDAAVEVELDPAGMPALLERLEEEGLAVVGWYHSHPTFATQPSVRDVGNQGNYQRLFADAPFVGAIVGPWDAADDAGAADVRWFHVTPSPGAPGGAIPRQLAAEAEDECRVGGADVEAGALQPALEAAAREAAGRFAGSLMRTDFKAAWRTATAAAPAVSCRDKLAASMRARFPPRADAAGREEAEALLQRMLRILDDAWAEHA